MITLHLLPLRFQLRAERFCKVVCEGQNLPLVLGKKSLPDGCDTFVQPFLYGGRQSGDLRDLPAFLRRLSVRIDQTGA